MQEEITYYINNDCINCGLCVKECPENCIDVYKKPAVIDQSKMSALWQLCRGLSTGSYQRLG